jgi:hypothetical protein
LSADGVGDHDSNFPSSYLGPQRWHFYSITSSARAGSIGGLGAFIMIAKNLIHSAMPSSKI